MTWLSRLLPNGRSSLQRATKRRRRIMKLELLENRTLLSNVTVSFAGGTLTILGDNFNDSFSITEQSTAAGGKVTVASTSLQTTINRTSVPFVSTEAVTSIVVRLPGTTNFDTVSLLARARPHRRPSRTLPSLVRTTHGRPRPSANRNVHRQWGRQQRRVHAHGYLFAAVNGRRPHCPRGQQLVPVRW